MLETKQVNFNDHQTVLETILTLKALITTAADNILKYFFFIILSEKIKPDISYELSA